MIEGHEIGKAFMKEASTETIIVQQRLHWGIFVVPLLAVLVSGMVFIPVMIVFHVLMGALSPMDPHPAGSIREIAALAPALPFLLISVLVTSVTLVAYWKSNITLTDRRLIFRTGLLVKTTGELPLENVDAIVLAEPLLGRILKYGTVMVTSVGGLRFPLRYLAAPQMFHAAIQRAVQAARADVVPNRKTYVPAPHDDSRYMPK
ncbi:PH domain-containing protein [bacterium]|nr:PH domain-containing protein [bacterium]